MNMALRVSGVNKSYPKSDFHLKDAAFEVPSGSIMGLVGENGAGKTTILKIIMGAIDAEAKEISLFGLNAKENRIAVNERIGVVFEDSFFPEAMSVKDVGVALGGVYEKWDQQRYEQLIELFKLEHKKQIKQLSRGMRMKLQLAAALSHHAELLILDEATSGLDPVVRDEVLDLLRDFIQDESHSVLLSTHITSDLDKIADYITFMHEGSIVFSRSRDELLDTMGIIHCSPEQFNSIPAELIIYYKKEALGVNVFVSDRSRAIRLGYVCDRASIEEIMLLMIRGIKGESK